MQGIGDAFTEDHLLFAGFKAGPRIVLHKVGQRTETALLLRVNAFHLDGAHIAAALHQPGEVNIWRRGNDAFDLLNLRQRLVPVVPRLVHRFNLTVRDHRQNAVVELAFEAVHRAQANDQHRHAQRDTDRRNNRNQRHHPTAPPSTAEAQGNQ